MNNPAKSKFDTSLWNMSATVTSNYHAAAAMQPWWAKPMNSQPARLELARQIIARCGIARIVETGTFLGTTTEFFAQYNIPVTTVEIHPEFANRSRERLKKWPNVNLRNTDSTQVMQDLAREPIDRSVPTLFYLDAHWQERLPLGEEAELAIGNFSKAVLMVDDFEVPDDPGYGFDDYGPGKRLCIDYLLAAKLPAVFVYFPSTPSDREGGARRGCAVVTASPELAAILDGITLLRRWKQG